MSARVTFSAQPVVWIRVRGEGGGTGQLPRDDGLVQRLNRWLADSNIVAAVHGSSATGAWASGFEVDDAERVLAWLRENGVSETSP